MANGCDLLICPYSPLSIPSYNYSMPSLLPKVKQIALDILFPPICILCERHLNNGEKEKSICTMCLKSIPVAVVLTCPVCGARLADNKKTCHKDSGYRLAASSSYNNDQVKKLIWRLKYEKKSAAAKPLALILETHLRNLALNISDYHILPVPLHKNRERERGFNQAALIAEHLSKKISLPVIKGGFIRTKDTEPQAESKNFEAREKNVLGSFQITNPEFIKGKNIILLDDVFTSGSTMNEAVEALKTEGAAKILALVVAKV